jgi:hypothetical protein
MNIIDFVSQNILTKYGILLSVIFLLTACDALLMLSYVVENKTDQVQRLKVDRYPLRRGMYSPTVDTIIDLKPNQRITIGITNGIGFPWETKKLYVAQKGQHFEVITEDSTFKIDYSSKNWHYKNGASYFKITDKKLGN